MGIEPATTPLDRNTFNKHYDHLMETGEFNPDIIPHLDAWQAYAINEAKKSINRFKNKK
jgi:hypothetical protein